MFPAALLAGWRGCGRALARAVALIICVPMVLLITCVLFVLAGFAGLLALALYVIGGVLRIVEKRCAR